MLAVDLDAPEGERELELQHDFPRVTLLNLRHEGGKPWVTAWRRSDCGFVLWTRRRCVVETSPFGSWFDEPKATAVVPLASDGNVAISARAWFRLSVSGDSVLALFFYAAQVVAQTQFGERLPFFVYGTLRSGYANHRRFMKDSTRIGDTWRTVRPMALFCGRWPYLIETPPHDVKGEHVTGELYHVRNQEDEAKLDELEQGYRKELVVVKDDNNEARVAVAYFGETVTFDKPESLKYVRGGDLKAVYPCDKFWT